MLCCSCPVESPGNYQNVYILRSHIMTIEQLEAHEQLEHRMVEHASRSTWLTPNSTHVENGDECWQSTADVALHAVWLDSHQLLQQLQCACLRLHTTCGRDPVSLHLLENG